MRQVVIDIETTGMHHDGSPPDRIIEIGCVELQNRSLGKTLQSYINPEREISEGAQKVHGIKDEELLDKPLFAEICGDFLDFIKGAELIAHNASFDVGFLNAELRRMDIPAMDNPVTDTLRLAGTLHPGQKNNLDSLCDRYSIDRGHRDLHGALLDADLLARVYLRMTVRQDGLLEDGAESRAAAGSTIRRLDPGRPPLPRIRPTAAELQQHRQWFATLKEKEGVEPKAPWPDTMPAGR